MSKSFISIFIIVGVCLPVQLGFSDRILAQEIKAQGMIEQLTEANRFFKQGFRDFGANKFTDALKAFQQSLFLYREIGDRQGEAALLGSLGYAYNAMGEYQRAIDFYQQSVIIFTETGDSKGLASMLSSMAVSYDALGQYQKSVEIAQKALKISTASGDRANSAYSLINLGNTYNSLGQYQKAIASFQESLAISKTLNHRDGESSSINGLGNTYYFLGQYQRALEFFQRSLLIDQELSDRGGAATSFQNIANTYQALEQYPKAIEFSQQSLTIETELGNRNGIATSLNNIGNSYLYLQQYQKAIGFYEQALVIQTQIADRPGIGNTLTNLGIAYRETAQYPKAIKLYQQALGIFQEIGDRTGERKTLNNLGTTFAKLKLTNLAIYTYKNSIAVTESIRKDISKLNKEDQTSYLDSVAQTYRRLADLLLSQGRVMEALQILDLLKVQELKEFLRNANFTASLKIPFLISEQELDDRPFQTAASLIELTQTDRDLGVLIKQIPLTKINQVPKYLQNIPKNAVLLYPLILSDRLEIILFSPNHPPINRKVNINSKILSELVLDFRSDLQNPLSQDVKISGKKLYDLMIKPIESDLKAFKPTTILYAPDGVLRYLPLSALYDGNQWLIEKYQVNNLIAYSLFNPNSQPRTNFNIAAGAFGGQNGQTRFGGTGLPATIGEVENISKIFPNVAKLTESNFTASAFRGQVLGKNIIHFATHAVFNSGNPLDSYILFGDGSKVTLAEISEWQLKNADLVVLSACETAIGTFGSLGTGTEILGFGYQVQRAGARAAIASLWAVSDGGTQVLMNGFYQNFQTQNILNALRNSQINMIKAPITKDKVNFNHPYFWSSFVLIGSGL